MDFPFATYTAWKWSNYTNKKSGRDLTFCGVSGWNPITSFLDPPLPVFHDDSLDILYSDFNCAAVWPGAFFVFVFCVFDVRADMTFSQLMSLSFFKLCVFNLLLHMAVIIRNKIHSIPYSRKIWRGIKFGSLAIWFDIVNIKSANINYWS